METLRTEALPRGRHATYWLIFERGSDSPAALTVGCFPDEEALAVFSFEEEASLFLSVQGLARGWAVKEVGPNELVSVLLDSSFDRVALDPLPGSLGGKMVGLLSMERGRFAVALLRKWGPAAVLPSYAERRDRVDGA